LYEFTTIVQHFFRKKIAFKKKKFAKLTYQGRSQTIFARQESFFSR